MAITSTARRAASVAAVLAGLAASAVPAHAATADTSLCERLCVLDARTGAHPDYDRVVLDLTNNAPLPTVHTRVSSDPTYHLDAADEDRKLQITGKSYLFIDIAPVDDRGTYTSPAVQAVSLPSLKGVQLAHAGGFELDHTTTFGLTLGDYTQYKVSTLTAPNRVVVDIYH
ncbi:AMIN-like domain-containing (lipo)protein [Streptomyces melanogenes]|uniref:AMIN-like domain-containing (lipo)protein n=1 Tax=Streptomyces melanogenes TaxID=67326 RepID=UPI0037AE2342